jgi:fatty acid desaturase
MRLLYFNSDLRSIAFILAAIVTYAAQWAGLIRHPILYAASLSLAFIGCVINHNHQHHPTLVPRSLNKAFGVLISLAVGVPATAIIPMHNFNHHVHNNHPQDFARASIVQFRWKLLNLLVYPFVALAGYLPTKSGELRKWRTTRPQLYQQLMLERFVLYPTWIGLLVIRPIDALIYFAVPYFFGQWAIIAINHVQHVGCDPYSDYNHSRNVVGGWLNWWAFNNGYHTAHHFRPNLHWSLLPEFHAEIREKIDPRLERKSALLTLAEMYLWPGAIPDLNEPRSTEKQSMSTAR